MHTLSLSLFLYLSRSFFAFARDVVKCYCGFVRTSIAKRAKPHRNLMMSLAKHKFCFDFVSSATDVFKFYMKFHCIARDVVNFCCGFVRTSLSKR